jgi:DNA-binding CsgD family transcriptional regulator
MGNRLTIEPCTELRDWLRGPVRDAVPHQSALVLNGSAHSLGFAIEERTCVDLPEGYLAAISNPHGQMQDPLVARWMQTRTPQYFDVVEAREDVDPRWLRDFEAHGLQNCVLFGKVDPSSQRVLLLALYNLPAACAVPDADLCEALLESLQAALALGRSAMALEPRYGGPGRMTPAEQAVLKWVRAGKTNHEIGMILGRSRFTVKTHIQRMLAKTGFDNRAQLADFAKRSETPSRAW